MPRQLTGQWACHLVPTSLVYHFFYEILSPFQK
jgi:hypothetical protein